MSHDYHEQLPGFAAAQILHDGCGECEERSRRDDHGVSSLDAGNFVWAWSRAAAWNRNGLSDLSSAEMPLLSALWSVQVQLERLGVPIGTIPAAVQS